MDDPRRLLPLSPQQFHILLALVDADRHGYGIIVEVAARTRGELRIGTGTLYTAIAGLAGSGLLAESHPPRQASTVDSRRRYYTLTALGRKVLDLETERLEALVRAARRKGIQPQARPATSRSRS